MCCLWKARRPQRRHWVWVLVWRLPNDEVPFVCRTESSQHRDLLPISGCMSSCDGTECEEDEHDGSAAFASPQLFVVPGCLVSSSLLLPSVLQGRPVPSNQPLGYHLFRSLSLPLRIRAESRGPAGEPGRECASRRKSELRRTILASLGRWSDGGLKQTLERCRLTEIERRRRSTQYRSNSSRAL